MAVFPTEYTEDQKAAVNEMLMSIGQAPLTTLENTNPDVTLAFNTLLNVSKEIQSEGWTFNMEYDKKVDRDSGTNKIDYKRNALQMDLTDNAENTSQDAVVRADSDGVLRMYNRAKTSNHFIWDYNPHFDIKYFFDFDELPRPILNYVIARASTVFASRIVGDMNQFQLLSTKEANARAQAMEYECNQGDHSFFGTSAVRYQPYKPYNALLRS